MNWVLDKNRPICPQIGEQLAVMIAGGELKPNERLLSVRDVAVNAGINPNTAQKAFEQLGQEGLIYAVRGSGWYVSEDIAKANEVVARLMAEKTRDYFDGMRKLGQSAEQTKDYVKEWKTNE